MREYFSNIYLTVKTVLVGMAITLKYCFARTVTVQYPDMPPTLQSRFRGLHWYEIQKCIGCEMCAKACPVSCIYIEKTGPRKLDKATGIASGGAMTRFAIDYTKCMFCALCTEACPTGCLHMSDLHDLSGFDRKNLVVEFTELARQGWQVPRPLWMEKEPLPQWARQKKEHWEKLAEPVRGAMLVALTETKAVPPPVAKVETPKPTDA